MLLYIDKNTELIGVFDLVGERGLEPPTLAGLVPKTSAYTNSATRPYGYLKPCPPGRIRTYDHLLKRELLYQLSYRRIFLYVQLYHI